MEKKSVKTLSFAVLFLGSIITLFSCSKSSTNANLSTSVFSWSVSGATYTADNDTAFISGPFTIIVKKDENLPASYKILEINLSAFTTGAYVLSAAGTNQVNYLTSGGLATSQGGTLNITTNTGSTLSGNFTTTLPGSVTMTGTFSNVPIKP
jgi:hypothetical protein